MDLLKSIESFIWGLPLIILLIGTGIYFTVRLRFLQVSKLLLAFKYVFSTDEDDDEGDVTPFQALCTALSSTIGTGNIVGVSTAIMTGGPGALFWMWMAALFGMATKYAEGLLAVVYRTHHESGYTGGPMYYLERGLNHKFLAMFFAFSGVLVALFGLGTFPQTNSIAEAITTLVDVPLYIIAFVLVILVGIIIIGGIKRIANVADKIIPIMSILYIVGVIIVIGSNIMDLPSTVLLIIHSAFDPTAVAGGGLGIGIISVIQIGVSRGIFSNESGLGSAPIAAAAAKTHEPVRQGLVSMTGTFLDTIVICTMTGLAIVISGAYSLGLEGSNVTTEAFASSFSIPIIGILIVNVGLILFAFTTIIGWSYYGEKCAEYLFGEGAILPFKIVYIACVGLGPFLELDAIFVIANIFNGLMIFPNLVGLIGLRNVVIDETKKYFNKIA